MPRQRPGVVLLLALVLMAAIVASTIAIATSVADSARQSQNLDDFVIASLAADSGLEKSLDVIKLGRSTGATITRAISAATLASSAISSSASVAVTAGAASQPIVIPQLQPNQAVTFDYLGYDPTAGALQSVSGAATISVLGDAQHCTITPAPNPPVPCNGRLEVSWLGLDQFGQPFYSGRTVLSTSQLDGVAAHAPSIDLLTSNVHQPENDTNTNIGSTTGFRITVRALDTTPHTVGLTANQAAQQLSVNNLTITQVTQPTCLTQKCLTGLIGLSSTGSAGTSQSIKQASVLWQLPASPLLNYVVFTEGDIIPAS